MAAIDKLGYEIFSILESKFLFGSDDANARVGTADKGKVRVLSIDAGGSTEGLLAAASLSKLESSIKYLTGNPSAAIADFFDVAAGSGAGGVLAALLFSRGPNGRPLLSAAEALLFLVKHRRDLVGGGGRKGIFRRGKVSSGMILKGVFKNLTLRDTVKPVLIPCFDVATAAQFVFSRADAMETDAFDFRMWEVCAATMGVAGEMRSVDGRTGIAAAGFECGGVAMGNPAAVAVTHVLNNKMEFPFANGVEDLFLVSVGNGEVAGGGGRRRDGYSMPSETEIVRIAGDGISDLIDQALGMAFGQSRTTNYVRIQGRGLRTKNLKSSKEYSSELLRWAEEMLAQKSVESVLFRGKKMLEKTNVKKIDLAAVELVKEWERRGNCPVPVVVVKQGSPRSSSSRSSVISSSTSSP